MKQAKPPVNQVLPTDFVVIQRPSGAFENEQELVPVPVFAQQAITTISSGTFESSVLYTDYEQCIVGLFMYTKVGNIVTFTVPVSLSNGEGQRFFGNTVISVPDEIPVGFNMNATVNMVSQISDVVGVQSSYIVSASEGGGINIYLANSNAASGYDMIIQGQYIIAD